MKRKRRYKKRKFVNNKRRWRSRKRILKGALSSQPYHIDSATMYQHRTCTTGHIGTAGLAPIGCFSGFISSEGEWPYPSIVDGDDKSLSDLARIAFKLGIVDVNGNLIDQGQKILVNYSKVQYNIRNNTNIALNLRMFHFKPRKQYSLSATTIDTFSDIWTDVMVDSGTTLNNCSPLTHPTDFQRFNKYYKITQQKNVRLLPGENIYVSQITLKNAMFSSATLNSISVPKWGKFFGILFNGDPVHDYTNLNHVSNALGILDITASYKLKFRRLAAPLVQNQVHLDNDLPEIPTENTHHVAMFANVVNSVLT